MVNVGFAMCGSFCTFSKVIPQMSVLKESGYNVIPIMSQNAYSTDTCFGKAKDFTAGISEITGNEIIHTIFSAEPIGPKKCLTHLWWLLHGQHARKARKRYNGHLRNACCKGSSEERQTRHNRCFDKRRTCCGG